MGITGGRRVRWRGSDGWEVRASWAISRFWFEFSFEKEWCLLSNCQRKTKATIRTMKWMNELSRMRLPVKGKRKRRSEQWNEWNISGSDRRNDRLADQINSQSPEPINHKIIATTISIARVCKEYQTHHTPPIRRILGPHPLRPTRKKYSEFSPVGSDTGSELALSPT